MGVPIKHPEPGSKVLNDWMAQRRVEKLVAARQRAAMGKREWWSGVAGMSGSGFAGAAVSRLTASLAQSSNSVNLDLDGNLVVLRARARSLAANNEFARRFLNLVAVNVVGPTGPTLQVRAQRQDLQLDKPANDAVEMAYARWSKSAELTGRMDLAHLLRVAVKSVARDGEALIRFVRGRSLPHGIQLQVLEADRLDEALNRTLTGGAYIRQGVEFDGLGRPVAYYIKASHPGDSWTASQASTERVAAKDVLHVFLPERAEQVRGYTWMHAVLLRVAMLHAYEEAAVVAARVGASKMGVFQRKDAATPSVIEQMADTKVGDQLQMTSEPGEFMELPPGYELGSWDPEYPHANFESFLKQCMRGVASGLDVSTHNLSGDMTDVNYSSARIAELAERDQWTLLQGWWNHAVMQRVYTEWLASALLRGEVTFAQSGKQLPADKLDKFISVARFQSRRWQWVDPSKEVDAAERMIAAGLNSRTSIAASQGREIEDIIDELQQEKQLMDAAGITPEPAPAKPSSADVPARAPKVNVHVAPPSVTVNAPVSVPERSVQVQAGDTHINVPEREVSLEATIQNNVDTKPAQVVIAQPQEVVETIERDADHEITRIVRTATH